MFFERFSIRPGKIESRRIVCSWLLEFSTDIICEESRFVNSNKIPTYCTIEHLDNKYSKDKNSYFGKIKVENLLN